MQKNADYRLALKQNHENLYDDVKYFFENDKAAQRFAQKPEKDHGRVEQRWYALETNIRWLRQKDEWTGFAAVGAARSRVWEKGETREQTRYFITTLTDVDAFAKAVRAHWSIENRLHWHLDVTFREDASKVRKGNAPLVWNAMRKVAICILKQTDFGKKHSIKQKMLMAALDENALEFIVFGKSK